MASYRRTLIPDFILANPIYAGCEVTFYAVDADGVRTDDLITLYADLTSTDEMENPQTLDGEGRLTDPVYFVEPYIADISGLSAGSHQTGVVRPQLDTTDVDNANALALQNMAVIESDRPMITPDPLQ